jgi:hypothetical protein
MLRRRAGAASRAAALRHAGALRFVVVRKLPLGGRRAASTAGAAGGSGKVRRCLCGLILAPHTLTHERPVALWTLQKGIQAHQTKFKRSVERPKTHIGTSSQGPGAVPSSARLGIFWRAQGRVPYQTRLIYATSTVIVGGATWIVIDPPAVRTIPRIAAALAGLTPDAASHSICPGS